MLLMKLGINQLKGAWLFCHTSSLSKNHFQSIYDLVITTVIIDASYFKSLYLGAESVLWVVIYAYYFLFTYYITVTEFAKKTGDYPSLSATDIKVLALTYQLEIENVGTDHLKKEPEKKVLMF